MRDTLTPRQRAPQAARYQYHAGVLPGRFQIVTLAHLRNAVSMMALSQRGIVVAGSVNQSRNPRNPFTFGERVDMWRASLPEEILERIDFVGQEDVGNPTRWADEVEQKVARTIELHGLDSENADIALFGHRKDPTSFYLDDFPRYILEELPNLDGISATGLRDQYFRLGSLGTDPQAWLAQASSVVPAGTVHFLERFLGTPEYERLAEEASRSDKAAEPWKGLPYEVQFMAVDPVFVQGNRVLLVRRREFPGKGYWALPGSMKRPDETALQGAIRSLIEKTNIDLTASELRKMFVESWFMDDPWRSTRGTTVSFPSIFHRQPTPRGRTPDERRRSMALPRVKASDSVGFFTFAEIREMRSEVFEDHPIIIDQALDRLGIRH